MNSRGCDRRFVCHAFYKRISKEYARGSRWRGPANICWRWPTGYCRSWPMRRAHAAVRAGPARHAAHRHEMSSLLSVATQVVAPYLARWPDVDVDVKQKFQCGGIGALFGYDIDLRVTPDPLYKPGLSVWADTRFSDRSIGNQGRPFSSTRGEPQIFRIGKSAPRPTSAAPRPRMPADRNHRRCVPRRSDSGDCSDW